MPFELIEDSQPEMKGKFELVDEKPSRARSLISAPIKGAVKGAHELAAMSDPLKALLGVSELTPIQQRAIEMALPTQEKPLEKGLERSGRLGVSAIGGPESLAVRGLRTAAGAALGQLAEETGAPEWVQNLAELSAFIAPKLQARLSPTKVQKEAVDFLRSKGLSDKEITPLIQSEKKLRFLAPISSRGEKTEKIAKDISNKLGENYDVLKERGSKDILRGENAIHFDNKLQEGLDKISRGFRRLIEKDVEELQNREISAKSLIDFYQDINRVVKGQEGGKAVLNTLKPIIIDGLEKANPEIAKDYKLLNSFYSKNKQVLNALKPGQIDKFLKGAKHFAYLGSAITGNFSFLPKLLGAEAAQRFIRQFLINPRYQNISHKILEAIRDNRIPSALKSLKILATELKKDNPDSNYLEE